MTILLTIIAVFASLPVLAVASALRQERRIKRFYRKLPPIEYNEWERS